MNPMDAIPAAAPQNPNEQTHSLVNTVDRENQNENEKSIRSFKDIWWWFAQSPSTRYPIMLFLGVAILALVFVVITFVKVKDSYMPAGIATLFICFYGAFHFKTLIALKEQVDQYEKLNKELKLGNFKLRNEVNRLEHATNELVNSKESIIECNAKQKQNIKKFSKLQNNLQMMGEKSGEGIGKLADLAKEMQERWENELIQNQRSIFAAVFDEMEFRTNGEGMTMNEYELFLSALPVNYAEYMRKTTSFDQLAGLDDRIDIEEFAKFLDQMDVQSVVLSCANSDNLSNVEQNSNHNNNNSNNTNNITVPSNDINDVTDSPIR